MVGDVYRISDDCLAQPLARTDVADQHAAGVDTDTHPQRGSAAALGFGTLRGEHPLALERSRAGVDGMPLAGHRRATKRYHSIADEFVDRAAGGRDHFQVLGEHGHHALAERLGKAGEACDIREHHEWDTNPPTLEVLLDEARYAEKLAYVQRYVDAP